MMSVLDHSLLGIKVLMHVIFSLDEKISDIMGFY